MASEKSKGITVRLPLDQAGALEVIAQLDGVSVAEEVRQAIISMIVVKRRDPEFRQRVRDHMERNQQLLEQLAEAPQ